MKDLEVKLFSLEQEQQDVDEKNSPQGGRPIRIWMDGAFDMMHYGERFPRIVFFFGIFEHLTMKFFYFIVCAYIQLH